MTLHLAARSERGFRSARGASGLTRAALRASHGAAPARRAAAAASRLGEAGSSTSADATLAKTGKGNATPLNKFLPKVALSFYICSCTAVPEETAEPIVDLLNLNRGVSVGIAAREDLTAKRSSPGNGAAKA
jgi:hypothetical protein